MISKTDMPARIMAWPHYLTPSEEAPKTGQWYVPGYSSSNEPTPYIRADLVREAVEALQTARAWMIPGMNWTDETGAKIKADADAALSKLKEAGL